MNKWQRFSPHSGDPHISAEKGRRGDMDPAAVPHEFYGGNLLHELQQISRWPFLMFEHRGLEALDDLLVTFSRQSFPA